MRFGLRRRLHYDPGTPPAPASTPPATPPATPPSAPSTPAPDIAALIEKVRKEEKDKLYPQIESLKTENAALKAQLDLFQKQLEELKKGSLASGDKTKKGSKDDNGKEPEDAEITARLAELENTYKSEIASLRAASEKATAELKETMRKKDLEIYRQQKISEVRANGEDLLDPLVVGGTETEIDAAIIVAKQKLQDTLKKYGVNPTQKPNAQPPGQPAPTPAGGTGAPPSGPDMADLNVDQIRSMTPEDWAKHRDKIRAGIRQKFSRAR